SGFDPRQRALPNLPRCTRWSPTDLRGRLIGEGTRAMSLPGHFSTDPHSAGLMVRSGRRPRLEPCGRPSFETGASQPSSRRLRLLRRALLRMRRNASHSSLYPYTCALPLPPRASVPKRDMSSAARAELIDTATFDSSPVYAPPLASAAREARVGWF